MAITFGLDISHHQDLSLDLAQCRRDGCELAIIKAGEGNNYLDPDFVGNLAEAEAAGMLTAAYWYVRSNASAQAHVDKIRQVVPRRTPIIPDVEAGSGGVQLVRDIITGLKNAAYRVPLLYMPRWYWLHLGSPSLSGLPPLWSSRYPDNVVGLLTSEWATVPASSWNGYGGLDVALLQFTSSARIAGHQPLDANAFRGTRDDLARLLGHATPALAPQTAPTRDEEPTMLVPAGENAHVVLPCAGRPQYWYLYTAYGRRVAVHQVDYQMSTDSKDRFTPGGFDDGSLDATGFHGANDQTWWFEPDKPGPVKCGVMGDGRQPVGVSIRYSSDEPFTLYCG